ncbi:hypothetical protein CEQ21_24215 [Niallia circulans]|uniref:Uncharacterized protein n=1 Tax=Niallia circulans TaxID=1397 RepID=A0A553SNC8_NIACI|nr:hypothetical protein [Niallia circulans]TRZ38495.1 hypothetical protein CEQ21_24215 [Niallia circulans]
MSFKSQKFLNICMVVLSWVSVALIGPNNIKRFFPATMIISIIEILNGLLGKKRKWWVFYNKPNSFLNGEFSYNIGPFILTSFLTLKLGYGSFKKFMLLSALVHAFFVFPFTYFAKRIKLFSLVRINSIQFFFYFILKAPLLYLIQFLFERKGKAL